MTCELIESRLILVSFQLPAKVNMVVADAAAEQFQRIGCHQVDTLRISLERVGKELDGPHAAGVNTLGCQGGDIVSGDALRSVSPIRFRISML